MWAQLRSPVDLHLLPAPRLELLACRDHCRQVGRQAMVHTDQQGMCRGQWVGAARGTVLGGLTIPRSVGRAGSSMAAAVTWDPPTASQNWQATASTRRQLLSLNLQRTVVPPKLGQHAPQARPVGPVPLDVVHWSRGDGAGGIVLCSRRV